MRHMLSSWQLAPFGSALDFDLLRPALGRELWGGLKFSQPVIHHPGKSHSNPDVTMSAHVHDDEGQFARFASNYLASMFGVRGQCGWGGSLGYTSAASIGKFKATIDSGSIAYANGSATDPSGLKFLHTAAGNDRNTVVSAEAWPLLQRGGSTRAFMKMAVLVAVSAAATEGWMGGYATAGGTQLWTADAADEILLIKAQAANTYSLRIVQNGAAAVVGVVTVNSAVVALTPDLFVLKFEVGTAADGSDTIIELWQNGVDLVKAGNVTNLGGAGGLRKALADMFATTPPILQAMYSCRVNDAAARYTISPAALFEVD